ncbi:MAG TPA: hypothetical protein VD927_19810 [Chryseosolibacter sp.]|nr:hypothetical protein [Chryseosolibacter sp.]
MARQKSILKFEGRIGDLSFFKSQDGFQVRAKSGVSPERIRTDPRYARTRENAAEFGRAGASAKLLRTAVRSLLISAHDKTLVHRLTRDMIRVLKADVTNQRGERNVISGELGLLQGFEFNSGALLNATFLAPYEVSFDRASGNVTVAVPGFASAKMISAPIGSTHFRLTMAAVALNFIENKYVSEITQNASSPLSNDVSAAIELSVQLPAGGNQPSMVMIGIEFSQVVNGTEYSLQNGAHNALAIVLVDSAVPNVPPNP